MARRQPIDVDAQLRKIYQDPASLGSYGGVNRLYKEARRQGLQVSRTKVRNFLADELAYALHKPARRHYKRNKTYVSGIDAQWQADLVDVQDKSKRNGGFRYLITCIDIFSKFAWVIPIKDKSAKSMVEGFKRLFKESRGRKPKRLQTDKGSEFVCKPVQALMKRKGIHFFVSNSDMKAAVVERFNKTLKTPMWTYFTDKNTTRYVDVLKEFVSSYNSSVHSSIGMAPKSVRPAHENTIWKRLYGDGAAAPLKRKDIQAGELVRISKVKRTFEKGYLPNWSKETFHVAKTMRQPEALFEIHDKEGEEVRGNFYKKELQHVKSGEYVVEKVLKERRRADGVIEVLVKWEGWAPKYNSWILKEALNDHQ